MKIRNYLEEFFKYFLSNEGKEPIGSSCERWVMEKEWRKRVELL
jgi:hypothetical protein